MQEGPCHQQELSTGAVNRSCQACGWLCCVRTRTAVGRPGAAKHRKAPVAGCRVPLLPVGASCQTRVLVTASALPSFVFPPIILTWMTNSRSSSERDPGKKDTAQQLISPSNALHEHLPSRSPAIPGAVDACHRASTPVEQHDTPCSVLLAARDGRGAVRKAGGRSHLDGQPVSR